MEVDGALSGVYDIAIISANGELHELGNITLKFRVDHEKISDTSKLNLYYYNESTTNWELVGGAYADGYLTADVNHLSTFAVFEAAPARLSDDEIEEKEGNKLPDTASSMFNLLLAGFLLATIGSIFIFFYNRKKQQA